MIFIPLYFASLLLAYVYVRTESSKIPKIGLILCAIAAAITAIWFAILSGEQMGGLLFAAILIVIVFPLLLIGLGLALGGWSKNLKLLGKTGLSNSILAMSVLLPTLGIGVLVYNIKQNQAARAQASYAYQSLTIEEAFGPHNLSIAISPKIELIYACHFQRQTKDELKSCHDKVYADDYRLKNQSERDPSAPYLRSFKVFPNTNDCRSYTLNKRDCVAPEMMRQWCSRRLELESSTWCTGRNRFTLRFEEYFEPNEYAIKLDKQNWTRVSIAEVGQDYNGAPITISCSKGRDAFIESRQEGKMTGKKLGRLCRVKFLIAEKVELKATFDSHTPEDMLESARHIYEIANGYWADMLRRAGQ